MQGLFAALHEAQSAVEGLIAPGARGAQPAQPAPSPPPEPPSAPPLSAPSTTPEERVRLFEQLLGARTVDLRRLRELAFDGVPETPGNRLRSLVWKLLLGYLPAERAAWEETYARQRQLYREFKTELMIVPGQRQRSADGVAPDTPPGPARRADAPSSVPRSTPAATEVALDEHPLTSAPDSEWTEYFRNADLFDEIQKDVSRTLPDYGFYSDDGPRGCAHRAAILHCLFVYARLNPGIRYVQGMNELLAPLYYTLLQELELQPGMELPAEAGGADAGGGGGGGGASGGGADGGAVLARAVGAPSGSARPTRAEVAAEADAFFCFTALMAETRDSFCASLDHSNNVGVSAAIRSLDALLAARDPAVHAHLAEQRVSPTFWSFRWLTLLCTQEFDLPDVLRIWDSFLADEARFAYARHFCCAMVVHIRARLLGADFAEIVKTLQRYPEPDVEALHGIAKRLYTGGEAGTGAGGAALDAPPLDAGAPAGGGPAQQPRAAQKQQPPTAAAAAAGGGGGGGGGDGAAPSRAAVGPASAEAPAVLGPGGLAAAAAAVRRVASGGNSGGDRAGGAGGRALAMLPLTPAAGPAEAGAEAARGGHAAGSGGEAGGGGGWCAGVGGGGGVGGGEPGAPRPPARGGGPHGLLASLTASNGARQASGRAGGVVDLQVAPGGGAA